MKSRWVLFVPLAIMGHVTPLIAAAAMSGSSLIVIANAMRPTRCSARCATNWRPTPRTGSAGTGWHARTTTPVTAAALGRR